MRISAEAAIVRNFNGQLSREDAYRVFLEHDDWRIGGAGSSVWIARSKFVDCLQQKRAVRRVDALDELIANLGPEIEVLRIHGEAMALCLDTHDIANFRDVARAARIERALAELDLGRVRQHVFYLTCLPEPDGDRKLLTMPTDRGSLVAAFTTSHAAAAFAIKGVVPYRLGTKLMAIAGKELFARCAGSTDGVIVNLGSPRAFVFRRKKCAVIARRSAWMQRLARRMWKLVGRMFRR
ncbi:MAG: hypothetical protein ABI591_00010 [Kofleriaceae bacterium]